MRIRRHVRCSPRWMRLGSMQSPNGFAEARERVERGEATLVAELLDRINALDPGHPDVPTLTRDLRLVRVDQERARRRANAFALAIESGEAALGRSELDEALGHALEALEIDPTSERAQRLQEQALHISDRIHGETSHSGPPPATKTIEARNRVPNRPVVAGNWASLSSQHRAAITGAATVIVVATVIGTALFLGTPPTSSLVVLDATPWATITQIQNGDGEQQPLPEMRSTPLAVQLTPGAYTVSFEGPPPQSEKRTIEIRVESGAAHTVPVQRFAAPSVDEYFRPYLTAPAPVSEPGAPLEEGLQ